MSYWRSNITCRAIEIVSGFVQDALQPSELIVTGPKTRSITCYSRIIFFYKTGGGGGGPSLSDYICKFNKLNFLGRRPPPPAAELYLHDIFGLTDRGAAGPLI